MAQLKVRSYLTIRPTQYVSPKGRTSPYYIGTIKGINRLGGVVESLGKHLEQVNTLYKFRNEFLIQSQAQRIKLEQKGILLDEKAERAEEDKNKRWWRRFLDQKNEDESEKAAKKPESVIDAGASVVKKAISPLKKFLQQFSPLFEAFIRFTVVGGILNWITDRKTEDLAKTIGNVIKIFSFVKKLVGFGIGTLLDGLTNLFGGYDKITKGNLAGALQGLLGVGQFLAGVALIKGAQYIMMPWKLISDVSWVVKLFTEWGKINGESEGAAQNKQIAGYVDKNGNIISKEDFERAKKSAARNDAKRAKRKGKGWAYSGGQDAVSDRYRAQFAKRNKNFLQRGAQRTRIGFNRATRGVRGQFKAAGNWLQANPAKGNAIFSVVGGLARAGGGLMGGENAGQAVGAGVGQAAGGIAGFALGNMLLPGVGGIIGSMLGSFLGEWVGTKLGPIIDPIMKPIGNAFKLGFDIIGTAISPVINTFGEFLGSLVDGLGALLQLCGWLAKAGSEVLKFAWENSLYKKAIDGMIWVWKNKDNIGQAVKEALLQGAKGTLDALTFNVFDFDKQNKRFAGGIVPLMASGGLLQTDSPEVMGLKVAGSALVSTVDGVLGAFGIVGDITRTALSSDIGRLSSTFGVGKTVAFGGGRITAQVTKPQGNMTLASSSENPRLESIIGTKEVSFLTAQPESFKPQNDGSIRGLLADIYNGLVSLKIIGGDTMTFGTGPAGVGDTPMPQGSATDLVSGAKIFMELGLSPLAASYMSGNVQQESGWKGQRKPWVLNDGAGTNKGLISWNRGRLSNAEKFLGKPLEKASNAEQARWIIQEMKTSYKDSWAIVSNPKATKEQLKQAIYWYIGWGHEGARWKYGEHAYKAITGSKPSASVGGLIPLMAVGGKYKYESLEEYLKSKGKTGEQIRKALTIQDIEGTELKRKYASGGVYNYNLIPGQAYGASRDGGARQHAGQDLDISGGEAVQTFGGGIVAGVYGQNVGDFGYGRYIDIWNDKLKVVERIAELNSYSVKKGDVLRPGQIVGSGETQTGVAHIEVRPMQKYAEKYGFAGTRNPLEFWKSVGAATSAGGNKIKVTSEVTGTADGLPPDVASASGSSARTSLLGSSGEQKDIGTILEEAFKSWETAFGGAPSIAAVPKDNANKLSPSSVSQSTTSTATQRAVQTASEQHTTREASKPQGAIATVPVAIPMATGGGSSSPSVVVNKARPTAMVSQ